MIEDYHAAGKLTNAEMREINHEVVNKIYSFLLLMFHPGYGEARMTAITWLYPPQWDEPEFDESFRFLVKWARKGNRARRPSRYHVDGQVPQDAEGPP